MCEQGTGQVLVNKMTGHRCQRFCASDSRLHVTPQVVHSFVTTELQSKQSSTEEPAVVAEGYLMCQCFPYTHSTA